MADDERPATPVLVACAHGTASPAGRAAIGRLVADLRRRGLPARVAFVDVQPPSPSRVLREVVGRGGRAVVVPVLLSSGYHMRVDVAQAVEAWPDAAWASAALGPDPALVSLLGERLRAAGLRRWDAVVLAAAGSKDERARSEVAATAAALGELLERPVTVGFVASGAPTLNDAVTAARQSGADRVAVATYLLGPGLFSDRCADAGADLVTEPLLGNGSAPPAALAALVIDRYQALAVRR